MSVSFITSANRKEGFPMSNGEVVFVGRSNVGKSSLINALYGKVAYVGKTPGKTKLLNFFSVDDKYTLCDVPGYGYAKRSDREIIEFGKMMDDYFTNRDVLKLCILIADIRRTGMKDDLDMVSFLKANNIPYIIVMNKADKLSNNEIHKQLQINAETFNTDLHSFVVTSCLKKTNIDKLKECIEERLR